VSANAQPQAVRRRRPAATRATTRRIAPTTAGLMALCALILIGVVTVQIAVIRQNMDRSQLETKIGDVRSQNNLVHARIAKAESIGRIGTWATGRGMVLVPSNIVEPLSSAKHG
jgi:cell division protein FtsL